MNPLLGKLVLDPMLNDIDELEQCIVGMPRSRRWTQDSPVRFEIMRQTLKRGRGGPAASLMGIMPPTMLGIRRSLKSVRENPAEPRTEAAPEFVASLESCLLDLGASSVGYTRVPDRWIFSGKAIMHLNAIVMTMEMDKVRIDTAPSLDGQKAVMEIYRDLRRIANKGADYLRQQGYSAQAVHPLLGLALYPPLAQSAGLGGMGANGLIVTPEHGPGCALPPYITASRTCRSARTTTTVGWRTIALAAGSVSASVQPRPSCPSLWSTREAGSAMSSTNAASPISATTMGAPFASRSAHSTMRLARI